MSWGANVLASFVEPYMRRQVLFHSIILPLHPPCLPQSEERLLEFPPCMGGKCEELTIEVGGDRCRSERMLGLHLSHIFCFVDCFFLSFFCFFPHQPARVLRFRANPTKCTLPTHPPPNACPWSAQRANVALMVFFMSRVANGSHLCTHSIPMWLSCLFFFCIGHVF